MEIGLKVGFKIARIKGHKFLDRIIDAVEKEALSLTAEEMDALETLEPRLKRLMGKITK